MASTAVKFNLKGVVEDKDRHGNVRLYFRASGKKKVRLRETPGSAEFHEEVRCAREGIPYASTWSMPKSTVHTAPRGPASYGCARSISAAAAPRFPKLRCCADARSLKAFANFRTHLEAP